MASFGRPVTQNAMQYIPKVEMRKQVARDLRSVFNAKDLTDAMEKLQRFVELYNPFHEPRAAPKIADWAETNIPEGLSVFQLPEVYWFSLTLSIDELE